MRVTPPAAATINLGRTEANPTIGIVDYSERATDAFGITTVVKRDFSRRMSVRLGVPTSQIDENARALANLRATSALWVADSRFAWLCVTGYYEDLSFDLPAGDFSYCKLTVAGLAERETVADPGTDPSANGRASTLRFIQPTPVTDAVLVSSSVAENDAPVWSASTTYAKGARVLRGAAHRIYESAGGGNVGHDPADADGQWLDVGPTGRWAMLDQALGTSTIASASIEMVLAPGVATTALALLDTNAATVRVRAPGYDRTAEPDSAGKVLFLDLAATATDRVTVTITPAAAPAPRRWDDGATWMDEGVWRDSLAAGDGTVTVGTLLIGAIKALGTTEASPTAGITDYSLKETDDFGEVTVVERAWAKNMGVKALIRTDAVDVVANRIAAARAVPALWIGDTARDSLIVYGFFRDFSIEVGEHTSKLSLSIEGLSKAEPYAPPSTGSVAWPDITDPDGTKPANNADKTSENTSKDTNAVGGVPAASITGRLTTLVEVTIPAVEAAGAAAGQRITEARAAADLALSTIENEVERVDQRIDTLSANGGYDDTAVKAEIKRVDEVSLGRDAALGTRIDSVSASVTDTDTTLRALVQTKETAAVDRENAISQRVDQLIAEGGGGSEGVDTVARSEIQRVEQAAVLGQQALTGRATLLEASSRSVPLMLNGNAAFSDWPDGQYLPSLWSGSSSANSVSRVEGKVGRWAMRQEFGPGLGSINTFLGATGNNPAWPFDSPMVFDPRLNAGEGWYVLEADVELLYGQLVGSGLYVGGYNRDIVARSEVDFDFSKELDANGAEIGAGVQGRRYRFTKLVRLVGADISLLRFHPLTALQRFGRGYNPYKALIWHLAGIRPATETDLKAGKADAAITEAVARIKTAENTLADLPNRYATAQRATNIEASVGAAASRISTVETATTDGRFATAQVVQTLRGEYDGTKATVQQQAGVITGLGQKTAAYVRIIADAGAGPAVFSLWSDQYGGAWALGGNGQINGDLNVNGTITARKFNGASMAREAQVPWGPGEIAPAAGQMVTVPWSLSLPSIPPQGRFIYEYTYTLTTNAGSAVSGGSSGGKPITIYYVEDGGGLYLSASDGQGNVYRPRANGSDRVLATTDFAPTFTAAVRRGSRNETVDDGDTIQRYIAATYTLSRIDLKVTWVAI